MTATLTTKATILDRVIIENAIRYCSIDSDDWYIRAEVSPSGRNVQAWIHWCVDRSNLLELIKEDLACIDFTPSTWSDKESAEAQWFSIENVPESNEIPDDSLYFCRYLISEDL